MADIKIYEYGVCKNYEYREYMTLGDKISSNIREIWGAISGTLHLFSRP